MFAHDIQRHLVRLTTAKYHVRQVSTTARWEYSLVCMLRTRTRISSGAVCFSHFPWDCYIHPMFVNKMLRHVCQTRSCAVCGGMDRARRCTRRVLHGHSHVEAAMPFMAHLQAHAPWPKRKLNHGICVTVVDVLVVLIDPCPLLQVPRDRLF
jgi:hypothetical protein